MIKEEYKGFFRDMSKGLIFACTPIIELGKSVVLPFQVLFKKEEDISYDQYDEIADKFWQSLKYSDIINVKFDIAQGKIKMTLVNNKTYVMGMRNSNFIDITSCRIYDENGILVTCIYGSPTKTVREYWTERLNNLYRGYEKFNQEQIDKSVWDYVKI